MTEAAARALATTVGNHLHARFGARLIAVYQLGSLARGGFSPVTSDIDLALVLADPLHPDDAAGVATCVAGAAAGHPDVNSPVSVFWGSITSINTGSGGRFPAFDRLDLIDHGQLLAGTDVRGRLTRPDYPTLVQASADFATSALLQDMLLPALQDLASLNARGPRWISKLVLFPVRFIYLLHTGKVAGNAESAAHYMERYPPRGADLVQLAMQLRAGHRPTHQATPEALAEVWLAFLDAYSAVLPELAAAVDIQPLLALRTHLAQYADPPY